MSELRNGDYETFKRLFFNLTGIDLCLYKEEQMKRRLNTLRMRHGFSSFEDLAHHLREDHALLDETLSRMTINVTEFFRNRQRWTVLEKKISQMASRKGTITVWSAACSTGEEAYSLAILMSKYLPQNQFSILATDIDEKVLQRARDGIYPELAIHGLNADERRFFINKGSQFEVQPQLKQSVHFRKHDLLLDPPPKSFDLIVCRNVLIYFTEEGKQSIYHKLGQALKPEGILFVGSTEQIFNAARYQLKASETFFYEKL
ncbi:CheR family methyltransferase [Sporolactobacillus terrae]|uniref:protein-glutamate O-methyltransferase n=1 Tax=Sporolactobacillus terrae TaxID=269673 RepID=A0ABX5Q7J2_9BACL|nr:protein-glutamate O-methyltransferase CheR [Sporolactobacillus terrae]QAA22614.1 protein-glutamate O-methyltransferase CheR [Sporolactobacillus terrae]QAA25588.1 protein-glutamate O-methyltransferase CheR [Sporolactobacillus terrae]UAK17395.1 protein-glutamate O-methyltransferase CheR [Sporolactobacillus terrae]